MQEVWRPVPGFEGLYEVSDQGRVKSAARMIVRGERILQPVRERILRCRRGQAYPQVTLWNKRKPNVYRVHTLVLLAFVGPPLPGVHCRHLNGDRFDNRLCNLRWGTVAENAADKKLHGTQPMGEACGNTKLTASEVREILAATGSHSKIASRFGVAQTTISRIKRGATWRHITLP